MVIGTAAYMAPEQARGKVVDKRADIFAFGVVLYEMLTGQRPFQGEDVSLTLAAVMTFDPDLDRLPETLSPTLKTYLIRCLEKDPSKRIRDIGDVSLAMDGAFETTVSVPAEPGAAPQLQVWQRSVPAAIIALAMLGLGGFVASRLTQPEPQLIVRSLIPLGPEESFANTGRQAVAISPDGGHIVYSANLGLSLRPVDQLWATPLASTVESAGSVPGVRNPFFHPIASGSATRPATN